MFSILKRPGDYILIGCQGEHNARQVRFDISCWEELYGAEGRVELIYQRPKDASPYPVVIEREGSTAVWTITATDTANNGYGRAELRYYIGDTLAKSATSIITVSDALDAPAEVPDPPSKIWLDQVLEAARRAEHAADRAEGGGGSGGSGADGGYYTPKVSQPSAATMLVEHTPSKAGMPAVEPVTINLPVGSGSSHNVNPVEKTDDMTQPVGVDEEGKLFTRPGGESSSGSVEFIEEKTELNNPITDIIGTAVANSYTGKLTHKCVTDTTTVYNGGMLCNDPPAVGVMAGETKFNSSGDGRTEAAGTVNVRWITINNTHGKNDFTFTSGDDVEIFAPGGEITRVDGTVVNATTGGFGDQILHDTANDKYIVIAEAFVGSENVVFARVATTESVNAAPTMEFTAAKELILTVDGVAYNIANGLKSINSDYDSVSQYNGDIAYVNGLFYWVLTNDYKGWIVLASSDGQNWEFNTYIVPNKGAENLFIEAAIGYNTNTDTMVIAGRTKTETGYMVLTAYHVSSGAQCTKLIPDCRIGSKPSIAQHKYGYYVGHNIGNRADYELLFVNTYYAAFSTPKFQTMDVWRVNAWHGVSTQYATIRLGKQSSHYGYIGLSGEVGYANLLHCYGMDGNQFNKNGASLTYDAFEFSALTLKNGNQVSLENAYYNKGLLPGYSKAEIDTMFGSYVTDIATLVGGDA